MGEMPGFIVNSYGELVFYPLPAKGEFAEFIDGFISAITPEESEIRFSKGSVSEEPVLNMEKTVIRKSNKPSLLGSIFRKKIKDEDAFRNVVTDRIAKFYYVDGKSGEKRKIALNREYVILDE